MSGTMLIRFGDEKELLKFKNDFDKIVPNGYNVIAPRVEGEPEDARVRGAYVIIPDISYGEGEEDVASFDYAIWDGWTRNFLIFLGKEICNRYKVKEAGWASTQFYSIEEFMEKISFSQERYIIEEYEKGVYKYNDEFKNMLGIEKFILEEYKLAATKEDIKKLKKMIFLVDGEFKKAAKRFFDGDYKDLIIKNE